MRRAVVASLAAVLVAAAVVVVARLGPSARPATRPAPATAEPSTYVALGGCETFGVGAADPFRSTYARQLFVGLDRPVTFVNLAVPGAVVAGALAADAPRAVEVGADLVTVWLGGADLVAGTPVADFERDLTALLAGLEGRDVLVATLPRFDEVPLALVELAGTGEWEACGTDRLRRPSDDQLARVGRFNAAIERAAAASGARVVDVAGLVDGARRDGGDLLDGDGFYPSQLGHDAVAQAFFEAFEAVSSDR